MRRRYSAQFWLTLLVIAFVSVIAGGHNHSHVPTSYETLVQTRQTNTAFEARVINVSDGDSITVRRGQDNIRVRLAQIDAPERGQPWGARSKQALTGLIGGQTIRVQPTDIDRYGRTVALIYLGNRNINADMVARGSAWVYRAYSSDPHMIQMEAQARANRAGLWAMPPGERLPPWDYRANQRNRRADVVAR